MEVWWWTFKWVKTLFPIWKFLIWIFQLTSNKRRFSAERYTEIIQSLSLYRQQAYFSIWQIKVLHTYSIIRLTRLSYSIIYGMWIGWPNFFSFFFFFMAIIFQLEPWIGWRLDSHQLTVEKIGLSQQSKNIKVFIRRYCKVLWLLFT